MVWNIRRFLTACVICSPLSALATPPDYINVHDEIFGVSPTHVFLTRTAVDNLGTHGGNFTFIVLVGKEIATGDETIWPIHRHSVTVDYAADDTGMTSKTIVEPQPDARNPYAVLAEFGGHPVPVAFDRNDINFWNKNRESVVPALTAEAITLSYEDKRTHEIATDVVLDSMSASITGLVPYAGEYWRFVAQITPETMLAGRSFDAETCKATAPRYLYGARFDEAVQLVRVSCDDDGELSSLYVIIPAVSD